MLVLALDTTTRGGSLALARDGGVLEVFAGDAARTHATRLPGDILDCLARHQVGLARHRPLRRRGRAGLVHRLANRHRDHPGARLRQRPSGRGGVGPRRAGRGGGRGRRRRGRRGRPEGGLDGRPAGRSVRPPLSPAGAGAGRRRASPSVNSPAGTLAAWAAALAGAAVEFVGDGAAAHAGALEGVLPGGARVILPVPPLAAAIAAHRRQAPVGGRPAAPNPPALRAAAGRRTGPRTATRRGRESPTAPSAGGVDRRGDDRGGPRRRPRDRSGVVHQPLDAGRCSSGSCSNPGVSHLPRAANR